MICIAIDFDSTLFPTLEKAIEIFNSRHNMNLDVTQITAYNLHECLESDVADALLELFCDKEVYDDLQPYKGSVKAIKTLVERGHEVYIATATSVKNLEWKEQLLQKYFPFIPKNNLIRIHDKHLLSVDVLVEDNMDNLVATFAERICFDRPWNQNKEKDYVYSIFRIRNWGEIYNIINDMERKMKEWERQ